MGSAGLTLADLLLNYKFSLRGDKIGGGAKKGSNNKKKKRGKVAVVFRFYTHPHPIAFSSANQSVWGHLSRKCSTEVLSVAPSCGVSPSLIFLLSSPLRESF